MLRLIKQRIQPTGCDILLKLFIPDLRLKLCKPLG